MPARNLMPVKVDHYTALVRQAKLKVAHSRRIVNEKTSAQARHAEIPSRSKGLAHSIHRVNGYRAAMQRPGGVVELRFHPVSRQLGPYRQIVGLAGVRLEHPRVARPLEPGAGNKWHKPAVFHPDNRRHPPCFLQAPLTITTKN